MQLWKHNSGFASKWTSCFDCFIYYCVCVPCGRRRRSQNQKWRPSLKPFCMRGMHLELQTKQPADLYLWSGSLFCLTVILRLISQHVPAVAPLPSFLVLPSSSSHIRAQIWRCCSLSSAHLQIKAKPTRAAVQKLSQTHQNPSAAEVSDASLTEQHLIMFLFYLFFGMTTSVCTK